MEKDTKVLFDVSDINEGLIHNTLKEVSEDLEERGYNSISQLVGFLTSGDLGYISSYKEARNKISKLDRSTIVEVLLKKYLQ